MSQDLSVAGPGSPVSLKKFIALYPEVTKQSEKSPVLLVSDIPIAKDDPNTLYVTVEECKNQALWFLENVFDGIRIPYYTIHHLLYMYEEGNEGYKTYADNESIKCIIITKELNADHPHYKFVLNKFKYGKDDPEFLQILGLLQLVGGVLKQGGVRIFVEHPETHLHPKRECRIMVMLNKLREEYQPGGFSAD
jgi:hypothetical protein